jgi:apolipoprotein D and lipocalin family protein
MRAGPCLFFAALSLGLLAGCEDEPLPVAEDLNLQRLQGKWFEIAKLPRATQADCTATTAEYSFKSKTELLVINECKLGSPNGPNHRAAARAVVTDPDVPAKLSLDFGFAYGDYWILEHGEDYEYVVIGHPTRNYFWVIAREPRLSEEVLSGIRERAKANGFPIALLEYTKH